MTATMETLATTAAATLTTQPMELINDIDVDGSGTFTDGGGGGGGGADAGIGYDNESALIFALELDPNNFGSGISLFADLSTVLTALFYGSAFILGTVGNGLIIYIVAHYPRMRTLSNVFLASLAIADLLLVCVCIPVKFVQLITFTWTFGMIMCKAIHYVQSLSAYCSVLTLTIISLERYYAIIHPVRCRVTFSMRHIRKMILITWILSAILASPTLGVYMLERIGHEFTSDHFWCVKIDSDWATAPTQRQQWFEARVIFELYQIFTILVLPTIIMIFTYSRICTHLWIVFHNRNAMRFGHTCHLTSLSSSSNNTSNTTNSSVFTTTAGAGGTSAAVVTAGGSAAAAGAFNASMSMSSTASSITTGGCVVGGGGGARGSLFEPHSDHNHHHQIMMANQQPPPTPTSLISFQSHYSHGSNYRRQSRGQSTTYCCPQCFQQFKTNDEDNQTVKQVIKMLVAVVVLFVLCWAPTLVIGLLRAFNIIAETNEGILREIITVTFLLSYLNSVINPIIYGFMSKNFRLYFRLIFKQFWSFLTTGNCSSQNINTSTHNHHNHHHFRNHNHYGGDGHGYHRNNHRKSPLQLPLQQIDNATIGISPLDQQQQQPQPALDLIDSIHFKRKRQSWEFSTSIPNNVNNTNGSGGGGGSLINYKLDTMTTIPEPI